MTVYTEHRKIQHQGNNSLQTFSYNFEMPEEDYAFVYITASGTDTEYTDVTWSGIGEENGGTVTFNTYTPTSTDIVTILRDVEYIQETDYIEGGLFRAETTEDTFDYSRFVDQQLKETLDRCIKAAVTDDSDGICMVLEPASERAGKYLWFNEDGCVESRESTGAIPDHTHDGTFTQGGQIHHHVLLGLLDDDHTQYLTSGRGDIRYYTQSQVNSLLIHNHDGTYSLTGHTHAGYAPSPHNNDHHSESYITTAGVTFEALSSNSDIGTGAGTVAEGNHSHPYYYTPPTDHSATGFITTMQLGESAVFGDLMYMHSSGKLRATQFSIGGYNPGMAVVLESGGVDAVVMVLLEGLIRDDSWSWTPGYKIYMGAGELSTALQAANGAIVQVCGLAIASNVIWFNPNFMVIERA